MIPTYTVSYNNTMTVISQESEECVDIISYYKIMSLYYRTLFNVVKYSRIITYDTKSIIFQFKRTIRIPMKSADMKTAVPKRISFSEPRAGELIKAIRSKEYECARELVCRQKVNVDGHTCNENTALTDAAKRGDVDGLRFLLRDLKANPHASCDCPAHRTALHYAAKHGHLEATQVLLEYGANPNIEDSNGYIAWDYTHKTWWTPATESAGQIKVRELLQTYKTAGKLPSK